MSQKLFYQGRTITEMSNEKLKKQLGKNKVRIGARTGFLGGIAVVAGIVCPPIALGPIAVAGITDYWLAKNNQEIKAELERRK